ncbi:MAG: sugar phosphate isomerase/epimerase [Candidatus Brocadiae bacterium]|nr:sugar phosphate isomerase/epimerase [Candidatus Brocadiia bacterium]
MARIPIGLQLFSVRQQCAADLPGTLKAVAEMGYEAVEPAGYHDRSAQEWKQMLDEFGLKMCGTHTAMDTLLGDELTRAVEFNQTCGNPNLIVPSIKKESKEEWQGFARTLSEIAEKVREDGMRVGYHNHAHDFAPMDGETPWDILFSTGSKDLIMQIDTGNALSGGADPVPYIERYPGQAVTVHLKEYSSASPGEALIGEGDVRWDDFFALCESVGATEWYIVEQASRVYPPLECVAKCLENLRKMGK